MQTITARQSLDTKLGVVKIETLKKKEFFRTFRKINGVLVEGKETYQAEGYDRFNKKYCGSAESDISKFIYKKKGTLVSVGFDY